MLRNIQGSSVELMCIKAKKHPASPLSPQHPQVWETYLGEDREPGGSLFPSATRLPGYSAPAFVVKLVSVKHHCLFM